VQVQVEGGLREPVGRGKDLSYRPSFYCPQGRKINLPLFVPALLQTANCRQCLSHAELARRPSLGRGATPKSSESGHALFLSARLASIRAQNSGMSALSVVRAMRRVKTWIEWTTCRAGTFCLSSILALGVLLAVADFVTAQTVSLAIVEPVESTLSYLPDDVLIISLDGTSVLRSELNLSATPVARQAKRGRTSKARQPVYAWQVSLLAFSAQLTTSGPGELLTPISLEPTTDIDLWLLTVLGWSDFSDAPREIHRLLQSTVLTDTDHSPSDWDMTIHCPQDLVDRIDLSQISADEPSTPASVTLGAASSLSAWDALEELGATKNQDLSWLVHPTLNAIKTNPLQQDLPRESRPATSRAIRRAR
jgi:hypothetical protein